MYFMDDFMIQYKKTTVKNCGIFIELYKSCL